MLIVAAGLITAQAYISQLKAHLAGMHRYREKCFHFKLMSLNFRLHQQLINWLSFNDFEYYYISLDRINQKHDICGYQFVTEQMTVHFIFYALIYSK